jgi:GDP-L-fucose synthase
MQKSSFKRILLFGSSGMVGQNLTEVSPEGINLICPSRREVDLTQIHIVKEYISDQKPDLIINCAGKVGGIQANIAEPYDFFLQNLLINQNLILSSKESGVNSFLNLGSSCMYPRDAVNPLKEESLLTGELEPTNEGYALAKIIAQRMIQYLNLENNLLHYKTVIPCNLYGKFDKFDVHNAHMIPAVISRIHHATVNNFNAIKIWGDGTAKREFMYAGDFAEIIWDMIPIFKSIPQTMNVGLGIDYSILDYYKVIAKIIGFKGRFEFDLDKPIGMKQKLVDNSIQNKLNLSVKHTKEEGIQLTYNYYLKNILN